MKRRRDWDIMKGVAVAVVAALALTGSCGRAQAPVTQAAVAVPVVAEAEVARLREGLNAAQFGNWSGLRIARGGATDPLVRKTLTWRLAAAQNSDALFSEIDSALAELKEWPGRDTMRRRGEQMIFDAAMSPDQRLAWLSAEGGPLTGDGQLAQALALSQLGRRAEAVSLVQQVWRERALTPRAEGILLAQFGASLTAQDHTDRVDRLLWRDDRAGASRLLTRLSAADRAVATARISLQANEALKYKGKRVGLTAKLAAVPASRASDPGLLYDRARYIRRRGAPEDALNMITRINPADTAPSVRDALFQGARVYVPGALRAGRTGVAYNLVSQHGLTSGESFADGEWLAGWIALRFLKDPAKAAEHFSHMETNVSAPVSKARGLYWSAQAANALGKTVEANAALTQAAGYGFTYYGQLAAERLSEGALLTLGDPPAITPETRHAFESMELVRALRLVAQIGDRQSFELMSFYLDDQLDTAAEHEMLAEMARANYYTRVAVRSAKAGIRRGIVAPDAAFPLLALPPEASGADRPEPALVLAIARQESEFDPRAQSPVGARGLMQIMPATARLTAKRWGMPYSPASLTNDPNYNLTLGSAYLSDLIRQFDGSYVLAVASYNAGPSRANQWISDWGDPRSAGVDVVDWVELIPFAETRNYVQRVMENLQVYRYRLSGGPTPIRIEQDLRRGG